jgi:HNH endonuclease
MLHLELKGKIVSCTSPALDKLYEHYKNAAFGKEAISRARRILNMLAEVFTEKNPRLNRSYVLSLYWLLSRITEIYSIPPEHYPRIRENFESLDDARLQAMSRNYSDKPADEVYDELSDSMSRGTDGAERIGDRHDILSQFLFKGVPLVPYPTLDPKRQFTHEEKLIVWRKDKGRCQLGHDDHICGRQIPFDDAAVDHIIPYSKGGKTTIENGRVAYRSCNIARGNRDDFDPGNMCDFSETVGGDGPEVATQE